VYVLLYFTTKLPKCLDETRYFPYTLREPNQTFMAKRKQIRDKWKAERKVQLSVNRRKKAIRITQGKQEA
jgi:hypothetical protein